MAEDWEEVTVAFSHEGDVIEQWPGHPIPSVGDHVWLGTKRYVVVIASWMRTGKTLRCNLNVRIAP